MNGNGINANALQQRQVLGGILSDVFGGAETVVSQVGGGVSSAIGGVTSAGGVLTPFPPTSTPPATRTSASTTPSSTLSSSSLSFASSSSPTSASVSASVSASLSETTSDGVKQTVTAFVTNAVSTPTSTPPTNKSFLQNKPLSGFVFALCGIVGLVLIILITTFILRRRGRKKLENEAISYDPSIGRGSYHDDMETCLVSEKASIEPRSSLGQNGGTGTYGTSYAPNPHGMYYDQGRTPAYGQQYPNYSSRSPNPFDQQPGYGTNYNNAVGAPVPPRSPNPAYDPERYSSELYRSSSRGSGNSVPPPAQPQVPVSLLNGANLKSPPPAAVRPPTPPQLPPVFGDNGSVDERQGVSPIDLKIANQ